MSNTRHLSSKCWPIAAFLILLGACATPEPAEKPPLVHNPKLWPQLRSPFDPAETAEIDRKVDALLSRMSLEQKVGQMVQGEMSRTTPEDVRRYHLGSVLTGGGGLLNNDKGASLEAWVDAMDAYHQAAMDTSEGALPIPIIWGVDALHGHNKVMGSVIFPHNIGLGATRNPELVKRIAEITARQVLASGMDWTFAPSLSVVRDDRWGRSYEGYSENPALVARLGAASVLGYQGSLADGTFMNGDHIIATAKHYIADGGTEGGVDRGNNTSSEEELIELHAPGYFSTLREGVLSIMISHSSWHGTRMHGEGYLINDILKGRLGFDGFVVGDWNSHGLVEGCTNTRCAASINAGVDMLMVPFDWKEFIENTIEDVNQGLIPMSRIDDAVRRILRTKFRAGIMDADKPSARRYANRGDLLAPRDYKAVGRQAVRESLVLLKNNNATLPLKPNLKVLVTGEGADNIPMQNGGWTISWQGVDTTNADFPNGTSLLDAVRRVVEAAGGQVEYSKDGSYSTRPDVAIVAYGEKPYAEWQGDMRHVGYKLNNQQDAKRLQRLQKAGVKTVSVFFSGRPLWVNPALNASDAFIAAWLPGTEAGGIADLLFSQPDGKSAYDFTGKLPFSWPADPGQTAVNLGDRDYAPLFPYGYGLTLKDTTNLAALKTDYRLDESMQNQDVLLFDGRTQAPWEMFIVTSDLDFEPYLSGLAQSGGVLLTEADQSTQGDSVKAVWDGGQMTTVAIINMHANNNFSETLEDQGAVAFDARLVKPSTRPVHLTMGCRGEQCPDFRRASVDITTLVNTSPRNEWNRLSVSLKCFANESVNFEEIALPFALGTDGELEIDLTNIQIEPGLGDKAGVQCQ